jgi:hypothetical protein
MSKLRRRLFLAFLLIAVAAIPATVPGCDNVLEPWPEWKCDEEGERCLPEGCCSGLRCEGYRPADRALGTCTPDSLSKS